MLHVRGAFYNATFVYRTDLIHFPRRLLAIDREEAAKRRKEDARNGLEGYLYRVRDLLEEEGETPFRKCSKEPERKALKEKLEETVAWLHDHGDEANTPDYTKRRAAIE